MSAAELDSLIVQSLADLDGASKRLQQIEVVVFRALGEMADEWARRSGWDGGFDWSSDDFWLAPPEWRDRSRDGWYDGYFEIDVGAGDTADHLPEEDYFYLTRLCQAGSGKYGFRFQQNPLGRAKWKRLVRESAHLIESTPFSVDEDVSFFMPFRIDPDALVVALREEAVEDALAPFGEALERLAAARPAFDAVVERIRVTDAAEA